MYQFTDRRLLIISLLQALTPPPSFGQVPESTARTCSVSLLKSGAADLVRLFASPPWPKLYKSVILKARGAQPDIELSRSIAAMIESAFSLRNASAEVRSPRSRLLQYVFNSGSFLRSFSSSHLTITPSNPGVSFHAFQRRDRACDVDTGL